MQQTKNQLGLWQTLLGNKVVDPLLDLARLFKGAKIVHVNSTREGGGVAEILSRLIPLSKDFGLDVQWETIRGDDDFFKCTKMFHNLLQGPRSTPPNFSLLNIYEKTNEENAELLRNVLEKADFVFIHDPQPLALISHFPQRKGKWIWRCHIDLSTPSEFIWTYLKKQIDLYDARIVSLVEYAHDLPSPTYAVPPSIDPFSEKNIELERSEIDRVLRQFAIDTHRPIALQVSRFDRFKDPLGVIEAYRLAKQDHPDLQLVLVGGTATDDPEGEAIFHDAKKRSAGDPDIHILLLPPTSHRMINAFQRGADIVLQKSLKEGFGLTVTEALWKGKPVIGGNTGGIKVQIIDQQTGFLVNTPQEAARRIKYLLENRQIGQELGANGKALVKENFLMTRELKDYLTIISKFLTKNTGA